MRHASIVIPALHTEEVSVVSLEVKEHFNLDIFFLLHDKKYLQEQLESTHICIRQFEHNLELVKQQQHY
ncbi:unnamed protein product [Rotaria sp. Silwood2]|nr:unnamed protein product [Rotaria sp. Silwood2]